MLIFSAVAVEEIALEEPADPAEQTDCLYYFYGETCPTCEEAGTYIQSLIDKYPNINVQQYEVYAGFSDQRATANSELLQSYLDAFDVKAEDQGIPALFTNKMYLIGITPITQYAEAQILDNGGSTCPSVSQRAVIGVVGEQNPVTLLETLTYGKIIGSGFSDIFTTCSMALLVIFLGYIFISLRRKVISRAGLFLFSSFVIQFLFGLSSFDISWSASMAYIVLGFIGLFSGIQIVMMRLKKVDVVERLVHIPRDVRSQIKRVQMWLTAPPGALVVGAVATVILAPCYGLNFILLSSLIVRESSVKPVLLLFSYVFVFLIPFIALFWYLRKYMKKVTEENEKRKIKQLELYLGWGLVILSTITVVLAFL